MNVKCIKCYGNEFSASNNSRESQTAPTYKGTVLSVTAKCSDLYSHTVKNEEGFYREYNGYVPSFFPNSYSGNDYIELEIDPYTGQILNWDNWKKKGEKRA